MLTLQEASLRHATFYLERIRTLDAEYAGNKLRLFEILKRLDIEWGNFQCGYNWAKSNFHQENMATYLCTMYPCSTTNLLPFRQNPREMLDWNNTGLIAAQKLGMRQNIGAHLAGIGLAYIALGNLDKSVSVLEKLIDFAKQIDDIRLLAVGVVNLSVAWIGLGQIERGREFSLFAIRLFHQLKDKNGKTRALGTLATAYAAMGQHRQALRCFEQCLRLHRMERDVFLEAGTLVNIGISRSSLGDYRKAVEALTEALIIVDKIGEVSIKGRILGNLANAYLAQGNYEDALARFEEALHIQRYLGDQRGEAATLGNIAIIYSSTGRIDLASQFIESSRTLFQHINAKKELAILLANLGLVNLSKGNYQLANDLLVQGYDASISIGDQENAANTLVNIGISLKHMGNLDEALRAYKKALVFFEDLKNPRGKSFTYTNLGIIYGMKEEHQKALEFYNLALEMDLATGDNLGQAINRINIAGEMRQLGKLEESVTQAELGLGIMNTMGDPRSEQISHTLKIWRNER